MTAEELFTQRKKVIYERILNGFYPSDKSEQPFQEIQYLEQFIFYLNNPDKRDKCYLNNFEGLKK